MIVTAELPLIASACVFAVAAIILALPRRILHWRARWALLAGAIAAAIPLLAYPLREQSRAAGRALWEWSAVGGPTVQAAYRFDGVAAVAIAAVMGYATATLLTVHRASRRHRLLPAIVLANAFVAIPLAVTVDLVAATVVLGVVAALTGFAQLLVAPASVTARLAGFYALGVQAFVVAALLISRSGTGSFDFAEVRATAISPGAILAASLGAALFAGLYPFVPWRYEGEPAAAPAREPLRGILAMPAGLGATVVLMRLLGATEIELSSIDLPAAHPALRIAAALLVAGALLALRRRRRPVPRPPLVLGAVLLAALAAYPEINWSHAVLGGALLSIVYAAAVSLAVPDRWQVVRYDVTLAGLWIGLAIGTPLSIAGGLFLVLADAVATMLGAIWLAPHRRYMASVTSATMYVAAALAIAAGIADAPDAVTQALAAGVLALLVLLVLVHIGRDLSGPPVPMALDVASGAVGLLAAVLLAVLALPAIGDGLAETIGRRIAPSGTSGPFVIPAILVTSALLVVVSRTARPLLPELGSLARPLRGIVLAADPVPAVLASFRLLESAATRSSAAFALFERRGGVWLAALLILGVLVWATRA